MTTPLADEAFLEHCTSYISNGWVTPELLARLFRMVGDGDAAAIWAVVPAQIITGCHTQVETLIQKARRSLLPAGPKRTAIGRTWMQLCHNATQRDVIGTERGTTLMALMEGLEKEFPTEVAAEKEFW